MCYANMLLLQFGHITFIGSPIKKTWLISTKYPLPFQIDLSKEKKEKKRKMHPLCDKSEVIHGHMAQV